MKVHMARGNWDLHSPNASVAIAKCKADTWPTMSAGTTVSSWVTWIQLQSWLLFRKIVTIIFISEDNMLMHADCYWFF
jgi:hypothetical protein